MPVGLLYQAIFDLSVTMSATQHSSVAVAENATRAVLRQPRLLVRETLAGVVTATALIPEVISFSVIAGVDPKVSLIASVVLCTAMSF